MSRDATTDRTLDVLELCEELRKELSAHLARSNSRCDDRRLGQAAYELTGQCALVFFVRDRRLLEVERRREISRRIDRIRTERPSSSGVAGREILDALFRGPKAAVRLADPLAERGLSLPGSQIAEVLARLAEFDYEREVSSLLLGDLRESYLRDPWLGAPSAATAGAQRGRRARKRAGAFYTPRRIAREIVAGTVGRLCGETRRRLGIRIAWAEAGAPPADIERVRLYRQWLERLTVLDPACGAGALLIEALHFLVAERARVEAMAGDRTSREVAVNKETRRGTLDNLFGVDTDGAALETARISLWLSAARDLDRPALPTQLARGDALLDDPALAADLAFDWRARFPRVMARGGFDGIVGNPPYGTRLDAAALTFFSGRGLSRSFGDIYAAFFVRCLDDLLASGGVLGFIAPNTWRLVRSGAGFRDLMLRDRYRLLEVTSHARPVFRDATVDCDTTFIRKEPPGSNRVRLRVLEGRQTKLSHARRQSSLAALPILDLQLTEEMDALRRKIASRSVVVAERFDLRNGVKPYERGKGRPPQSSETLARRPYTARVRVDDGFVPLLGGRLFRRYETLWDGDYWIRYGPWLAAPRDATIFAAPEKLVFRQTADRLVGTLVDDRFILRDNVHILLPRPGGFDPRAALAVLNSRLARFYYWTLNPEAGERLPQVKLFHLAQMPLPRIEMDDQRPLAESAGRLLDLHRAGGEPGEHAEREEQAIDRALYEIYKLSPEEIRIVENPTVG